MRTNRIYFLFSSTLLVSCSSFEKHPCGVMPNTLSKPILQGPKLHKVDIKSDEFDRIVENIQSCYAKARFNRDGRRLIFKNIETGSDGFTYIFFNIEGVLDEELVYRISTNDMIIIDAFYSSPLSQFDVPSLRED